MSSRGDNDPAREESTILPPGKRDLSGFWLPLGCNDLRSLVSRRGRRARLRARAKSAEREPERDEAP